MKQVTVSFFCGLMLAFFYACSAESEYSKWPCRFAYDNSLHLDAALGSAMDPNSPGTFCLMSEGVRSGVKYLSFQTNRGDVSEQRETAEEQQADFILGLNNGIIIGFANALTDERGNYRFVAFDVQCPNCVRKTNNTVNPNFRISISTAGIAKCPKCGKRYDLNSGGVILDAEQGDSGLEKYVASTSGPMGHVSVFRR